MQDPDRYRTVDVPVRGGDLRVGIWEPETPGPAPTVLAVHGITASHRAWGAVATGLPEIRVVAPDLRGRGRSRDLPGPYGIGGHADDLAAVLDHFELPVATVVGHSMGAFVTMATVARHPDRVRRVLLLDGGLPLQVPAGMTADEATAAILGPAQQRLSMTFPTRESYRSFMRSNPALANWTAKLAEYVDYDLVGTEPELRPSTPFAAMLADSRSLQDAGDWLLPALESLADRPWRTPFLRAQRNLVDLEPGLYAAEWIAGWQSRLPGIEVRDLPGTNHYSMLFVDPGLAAVQSAIREVA
jgi:lipase